MGYTEADAQADAAAADLAEQEALAQDAREEKEERQRRIAEFTERFNAIFPGVNDGERVSFILALGEWAGWLAEKKLSKSDARFMLLKGLAYSPEFKVDLHRDQMDVYDLCELIVPPKDKPGWGVVGRPKTLRHRIYRMVDDGLLEATTENRTTTALTLTDKGAFYLHQSGHFPGPALLNYWRHATGRDSSPTWDNPYYLEYAETGHVNTDEEFHHSTPGATRWAFLRSLHDDPWLPRATGRMEEYDLSLRQLSKAMSDIHEGRIDECFKILEGYDRYRLIEDVLAQSGINNAAALREMADQVDRGSYEARFSKLCGYYQAAHHDEDANEVIGELILRSAWVIVRQVMDHRMGDDYSTNTIKRADLGDPIAQLELDEYRMLQGWVDPETDYEPDEDSYGSRAQTR